MILKRAALIAGAINSAPLKSASVVPFLPKQERDIYYAFHFAQDDMGNAPIYQVGEVNPEVFLSAFFRKIL